METRMHLFVVEDDTFEILALRRALASMRIKNSMTIARDGVEALEILRGEGSQPPPPHPFLILLDLNMPRMGGLELLRELRRDPALTDVLVVVLTTSPLAADRQTAAAYGVAGYFVKAEAEDGLAGVIQLIREIRGGSI
jgi:CheY-like chemotaxis protein